VWSGYHSAVGRYSKFYWVGHYNKCVKFEFNDIKKQKTKNDSEQRQTIIKSNMVNYKINIWWKCQVSTVIPYWITKK